MRRLPLAGVCLLAACATASVRPVDLSGLAEADAKVLEGCYDCLLEARTIYRRVAVARARAFVVDRLFQTNLLIALREKELAIDPSAAMDEAEQAAAEMLPVIDTARFLAIVRAIPPDTMGTPRREMATLREAQDGFVPKVGAELAWLESTNLALPFRQYLGIALDCGYLDRPRVAGQQRAPPGPRAAPAGAPPLVVYRASICDIIAQPPLYRLREANARFADAAYWLARFDVAVARQNGPGRGRERLTESIARFPNSPSVTYLLGSFNQLVGNCEAALRAYGQTIDLKPVHEDAWLGRTICLTFLKRSDEAIEAATRMIALETDNRAGAYHWRAFNRHTRKELDLARADINNAKRLARTPDTLTLAGMIEYDQDDLDAAQADLTAARNHRDGANNCTAIWYLGLVQVKRQNALAAARLFDEDMGCYERSADYALGELRGVQARADLDEEFKAMKTQALEDAIKVATTQRYASAFNAANYFANGGDIQAARRLVEIAATDPALADRVAALRAWLKDK